MSDYGHISEDQSPEEIAAQVEAATRIRDCPRCGAEDALETNLRIDLDDVVLEPDPDREGYWRIASFVPAASANDPDTGLVSEEANISCRECGDCVEDDYPVTGGWSRVMAHWKFAPSPMVGDGQEV